MYFILTPIQKLKYKFAVLLNKLLQNQKTFSDINKWRLQRQRFINLGFTVDEESKGYSVSGNGILFYIRKNSSDIAVFEQVFINREYDIIINALLVNNINPQIIIDAGSNIGLSAIQFKKAFANSKVYAVEPDPDNYKQLQINLNQFTNCHLLQKALWDCDTTLYLDDTFRDGLEWSRSVSTKQTKNKEVQAVSMATLMKTYEIDYIDLLKIDVEGSEAAIFKTTTDLTFLSKTKVIAIEIHDEFNCRERIYDILRMHGFILINSNELTIGVNKSFLIS